MNAVLSLYSVGVVEPIPISYDLFKTIISVISVAGEQEVVVKVLFVNFVIIFYHTFMTISGFYLYIGTSTHEYILSVF